MAKLCSEKWTVSKTCICAPYPVLLQRIAMGANLPMPALIHVVLGVNEEGEVIDGIDNSIAYMEAYDGMVFNMPYESHQQLPHELKNAIDTRSYLIYHSSSRRFIQMPKEKFHQMKEL